MRSTRSSNAVPVQSESPKRKVTKRVASTKTKETVPSGINKGQASVKPVLAKEVMLDESCGGRAAKKPRLDEVVDETHEEGIG
jgi:hypothetical protein